MEFPGIFWVNLFHFHTFPPNEDQIIGGNSHHSDGTLVVDSLWKYSELLDKVCNTMNIDQRVAKVRLTFVWSDSNGFRRHVVINNDETVVLLYLYATCWPELYVLITPSDLDARTTPLSPDVLGSCSQITGP